MADEETAPESEDERNIWQILGVEEPAEDEEEPYAAEAEAVEKEAEQEDKLLRKVDKRVNDLQKKFEATQLTAAKDRFMAAASPLEQELFKAVASDVKDMSELARVAEVVQNRAKIVQKQVEEYEQEAKVEAAAKAHLAWGVQGAPIGGAPSQTDEDKDLMERVRKGDSKAGMKAMFGDDSMIGGLFQ